MRIPPLGSSALPSVCHVQHLPIVILLNFFDLFVIFVRFSLALLYFFLYFDSLLSAFCRSYESEVFIFDFFNSSSKELIFDFNS